MGSDSQHYQEEAECAAQSPSIIRQHVPQRIGLSKILDRQEAKAERTCKTSDDDKSPSLFESAEASEEKHSHGVVPEPHRGEYRDEVIQCQIRGDQIFDST